jgi:hypothetical protein
VTVIGWPARICWTNRGITEPRDSITLPYRTVDTTVRAVGLLRAKAWATFSIIALDMPIALMGYAALSVPRHTTDVTPFALLASITLALPNTLVRTASSGKNSQLGTCLSAAAWKT